MSTQGLANNNALKGGSDNPKKEVPYIVPQITRITTSLNGAGAFGLPPSTSKFRSGHLSENDMPMESDGQVFGGRHSLEYPVYSRDVMSSLVETMGGRVNGNMIHTNPIINYGTVYTEDESGDPTEFSTTTQVPSRVYGHISAKDHYAPNKHTPSAPPLLDSDWLIMQEELQQLSNASQTSLISNSCHFEAIPTVERKTPSVDQKDNHKHDILKPSNGNLCPESVPSSGSFHARLPTYQASSLGAWHSVIAYNACVRLCLHAWAKGCMEAPEFLENECALLRSNFGVEQYFLQPKEELLVKRASEGGSKGGVPKPKKIVEKIDCGYVAETVAYDITLEVAMKVQDFHQRNLRLQNSWKWLLNEFASYYGVSDAYTKLRYLSYIMEVATPTADCLSLVYELLLLPVTCKTTLRRKEKRILAKIEKQIEQGLAVVFENYKSLDENSPSGMMDVFRPATVVAPSVLEHAVNLYQLTNDILSPEAQKKLSSYFQAAAKKRWRGHLTETNKYVSGNGPVAVSAAYQKMTSLCLNIKNEISTDIEIHNCNILPSFIDLPNLLAAIYCAELSSRLRAFLVSCRPDSPSPHVINLLVAIADFQKDLATWNINPVKLGVDAKELFHLYIMNWIQDKRLYLLKTCKLDKVKLSGARTQHSTSPFVDEMYELLKNFVNDHKVIICRWPGYTFTLENAVADIEKAIIEALDKQYADVVAPLKESMTPKKFELKYVIQKLTKRTTTPYTVPLELGILLNSMKRMLDVLHPEIKNQLWGSGCIPDRGNVAAGGVPSNEVTVMLSSKFCNYLQAVVEKLVENTRLQNGTKLKKILKDSKKSVDDSKVQSRMQPLTEQLTNTVNHLHNIFETPVFIATCRGYWDRMGKDVLSFLAKKKENRSRYKVSRVAVSILDKTFASQMKQLLGNTFQEKDIDPPDSIVEVRSMFALELQER